MVGFPGRNLWPQAGQIQATGGISSDGCKLNMSKLWFYSVSNIEGHALQVNLIHLATGSEVTVPVDTGLKPGTSISEPYNDYNAYYTRPPRKHKIKLADFFAEVHTGPDPLFNVKSYLGSQFKDLAPDVQSILETHNDEVKAAKSSGSLDKESIDKLQKSKKEKQAAQFQAARSQALKKMAEEKELHSTKL